MKFIFLLVFSVMTIPLQAATVMRRVPLLYSSSLNRALVVAIADSGNYWISECEIRPNDAETLAANISNPQNACRRLREVEFPLADTALTKAIESFADSFYKEAILAGMPRGNGAAISFMGFAILNGGLSFYLKRAFPGSTVFLIPAMFAIAFGATGWTGLMLETMRSKPTVPLTVESMLSSIANPQTPPKIIQAMGENIYKTYREALAKAIDTVETDYSKTMKPRY